MDSRQYITLHEHEPLPYAQIGTSAAQTLEAINREHQGKLFTFGKRALRTRQYVGLVQTSEVSLQILPKIYDLEGHGTTDNLGYLLLLLRLAGAVDLQQIGNAGMRKLRGSFLEVWIWHFARLLHRLLKQQFRRDYVEVEQHTGFIRGKLLMGSMQTGREVLSGRYPCRYEVFTANQLLNQTLKYCNELLRKETSVPETAALLRANSALLGDVEWRVVTLQDLERIHLNRLNRDYEPLLELCRLLLGHSALDLRAGRIQQMAFVFDMNRLFENGIAALLQRLRGELQLGGRALRSVDTQVRLGELFGQHRMHVDVVLKDEDGSRVLLDTKYKTLDTNSAPAQSDLYQMHAYATAGDESCDTVILLYPGMRAHTRRYTSDAATLHMRTINPQLFYDRTTGGFSRQRTMHALNEVLDLEESEA